MIPNGQCGIKNVHYRKKFYHEHKVEKLNEEEKLETSKNSSNEIIGYGSSLCKELKECKLKEIKRRQQLRANSQELRQLERQLQSAVASKQLKEQIQSIAQRKEVELRTKREENEKFRVECELFRKSLVEQEENKKEEKKVLLGMLKHQISGLQQKRRKEFENVKEDHDKMDKLLKQVQAEEKAERQEAELLRERYKKEMDECYRDKKLKQQLEKKIDDDINESNLAYQKEYDNSKLQLAKERNCIQKKKQELSEIIGQQLAAINQEQEKRENLLLSLSVEERKAKDDQNYRDSLAKHNYQRKKMCTEMEDYRKEVHIYKEKQFKEEEKLFREERLRYLEELDKIEQLSNEMRHRKKIEHFKVLREMIEARRCEKANKIASEIADFEKAMKNERKSDQLIEEERVRMLSEVPKDLLTYLPLGVLKSSDRIFNSSN